MTDQELRPKEDRMNDIRDLAQHLLNGSNNEALADLGFLVALFLARVQPEFRDLAYEGFSKAKDHYLNDLVSYVEATKETRQ